VCVCGRAGGHTDLYVFECERFFEDVRGISAARESAERGQVAAVAAECFTHERPVLAALRRLLHTITYLIANRPAARILVAQRHRL